MLLEYKQAPLSLCSVPTCAVQSDFSFTHNSKDIVVLLLLM